MLSNRQYLGEASAWAKVEKVGEDRVAPPEAVLPAGTIPRIVDPGTFAGVARRLATNKQRSVRNALFPEAALLRAGYVRCGYCGGVMSATPRRRGEPPIRYACTQDHGRGQGRRCGTSLSIALIDRAGWVAAVDNAHHLEDWCRAVGQAGLAQDFAGRREALDLLGVEVRVWDADHAPRYEITFRIDPARRVGAHPTVSERIGGDAAQVVSSAS